MNYKLSSLLVELQIEFLSPPIIWCDNQSATTLANNPKFHSRTKHIELDIHFLHEKVANKSLPIQHVMIKQLIYLLRLCRFSPFIIFVPSSTFFLLLSLRGDVRVYSSTLQIVPTSSRIIEMQLVIIVSSAE